MKTLRILFLVLFAGLILSPAKAQQQRRPYDPTNPTVHDPVVAKQGDTYYLFCTGNGVSILTSKDLKTWERAGSVFDKHPEWINDHLPEFRGHMWAPDIIFYDDLWHVFYSCSAFAKNTSLIGHATTPTLDPADPAYGWKDLGMIVESVPNRDLWNAIDPNIIVDESGTPWMNFGSFWEGMKLVKLTADMGAIAQPQEWYTISRRERSFELQDADPGDGAVEAPFIFEKDGMYYLFVSFDYCCRGLNSDYKIVVGRSPDVRGPYFDKDGRSLFQGGGSIVMQGNEKYAGVGHCSVYHFDGQDYLFTHAYMIADEGASKLLVRKLEWDAAGWPVVME